jgi:Ca2+-binding EF-hand superfamily protein
MDRFKKGLIDLETKGQLGTVFTEFDTEQKGSLSHAQFVEYLYAIGMNFINQDYAEWVNQELFKGNTSGNRVRFDAFFVFLEDHCVHDLTME